MTAVDIEGEERHADNLEEEGEYGHVEEAEDEEVGGAEVEGEHAVVGEYGLGAADEFLAVAREVGVRLGGGGAHDREEALELRGALLLQAGVVDIVALEEALVPRGLGAMASYLARCWTELSSSLPASPLRKKRWAWM